MTPLPQRGIVGPVSKPRKVEEPQAPYAAKRPAKAVVRAPQKAVHDGAEFKRVTDKLFRERKELLHKLAQ